MPIEINEIVAKLPSIGFHLLTALLILFFGRLFIKITSKSLKNVLEKKEIDKAISSFITSLTTAILWMVIIIGVLSQVGVKTTSFIAILGAVGLAIGLALQGSLANFASGFLIVLFRPFKVNDVVDVNGIMGVITTINLFSTELKTFDNRKIIIPNSQIMGNTIVNITAEPLRRVDFLFSASANSEVAKVKEIIQNLITNHSLVLKEPAHFVRLSNVTHSSIDITVRCWCLTSDYWTVFFDLTEQVREEFVKNNIGLPIPQSEINIRNGELRSP